MVDASERAHGDASRGSSDALEFGEGHRFFLWLKVVTVVAVAFTFGNALWAAWDQGITYDEYYHLEWPRRLLHERVDERDSAFRFDSKTPALIPAVMTTDLLEALGVRSERSLRFASRLTPILYLAFCLGLVALLGRFVNPMAAWFGALLVALDPNMAANASIATSDVAYAAAVLLLAFALVRDSKSWASSAAIGVALGFAFATKYTAVLLLPVTLIYLAVTGRGSARSVLFRVGTVAAVCSLTLSLLYLGVGVGTPIGSVQFLTPGLKALAQWAPSLPLPFPRSLLTGIDRSMDHNAHLAWNGYVFGENHPGGVWYYFLVHWLMKTPVALVLAILLGLSRMRSFWRLKIVLVLSTLFVIHLAYLSFFFSTQLGLRYALLCIPLAATIAGVGLARFEPRRAWWLVVLVSLSLAERMPYWGDPIAFTNLSVWPKSRAYWYTADSNLDYGQNRERLPRYVKQSGLAVIADQATVTPGLYVVSANNLTKFGNFRSHRWLIDNDIPAINFGFTDFGFSITGERFEAYMNDTRIVPSLPSFETTCGGELPHYPPGAKIPFHRTDAPQGERLWVICARSRKGVDLGFMVEQGRLLFGAVVNETSCLPEFLQSNQQAWLRVPAGGTAQLCLQEIPFRRASLPYATSGYITVRGQGADVEIRPLTTGGLNLKYGLEGIP